MTLKTYSAKPKEIKRQWYVIDASSAPLGRVATLTASYLIGKHKSLYTPHIDSGDSIIIINAARLRLTGQKLNDKLYFRYTGYIGNLKQVTAKEQMAIDPRQIIIKAVQGMLPKNKLLAARLKRLKVYLDDQHEQSAQQPIALEVKDADK